MNVNDFLTTITAPSMESSTFAQNLREVFDNIDANFKKIVSAPYLEGQEGKSIEAYDMPITEDTQYGPGLTEFGVGMARAVFSDDRISSIEDIDRYYPSVGSDPKHTASEFFLESPVTKVFRTMDPDTGAMENWICSAEYYCFIDMRILDLDRTGNPSEQTSFTDYSCLVFADWDAEAGEWKFTKGNMMPTLYYSSSQECFCWKVNGVETGIRAQGIKGEKGESPKSALVKGSATANQDVTYIVVENYLAMYTQYGQDGSPVTTSEWTDIRNSGLSDGDLVACLFDIGSGYGTVYYPDMVIANIRKTGDSDSPVYSITVPNSSRFSSMWNSYLLFYACKGIDYKSADKKKSKAIFVPSSEEGIVHAVFQDDSSVKYTQNPDGSWKSDDLSVSENADLVFKKVSDKRITGSSSVGDANKLTSEDSQADFVSKAKFKDYEVTATVDSAPNVLLGVPVGSIVNWINRDRVPKGWYLTGDVDSEHHAPVFVLEEIPENVFQDYDVQFTVGDEVKSRCKIYNYDTEERDPRFTGILAALTGNECQTPLTIDMGESEDIYRYMQYNWPFYYSSDGEGKITVYLTNAIN